MVSDTGSAPAPDDDWSPEPAIRRGMLLPRVCAAPGAGKLSPTAVDPSRPADDSVSPGTGHRRAGAPRRPRARAGGVCAVALVAVVAVVAFTRMGSESGGPAADRGPAALKQVPPVPSRAPGVRPPGSTASARVTPSPSRSATPRSGGPHASPRAAHHWQTLVVHATYVLNPGDSVHSNRISLSLRTDGDLVLRDEHGRVTWSTGTHVRGAHAVFQADGNLVVYQGDRTVWSTHTDGHDGATLALQADGAMRILFGNTALWSTGTG